jgi:hypothetical protein
MSRLHSLWKEVQGECRRRHRGQLELQELAISAIIEGGGGRTGTLSGTPDGLLEWFDMLNQPL